MKSHKLLPLLTIACVGATIPMAACTTRIDPGPGPGPVPPTPPEEGSEFNFDETNYQAKYNPWNPTQDSYTTVECLTEYTTNVDKYRFEDDFLFGWQNWKDGCLADGISVPHLNIFVSYSDIKPSSTDETAAALFSLHVIEERTIIYPDSDGQTSSETCDLNFVDCPLKMVYNTKYEWSLMFNWSEMDAELFKNIQIAGQITRNGEQTTVNINKDNYDDNVDLLYVCGWFIEIVGINSLTDFNL